MTDDTRPTVRTTCRICHAPLIPILSLGAQYFVDFPNHPDTRSHPPVPLELTRCSQSYCGLVQLAHTTPPDWLYKRYWYSSSVNETMIAELHDVVKAACTRVELPRGSTVVDIGANDGTLLQQYLPLGHDRLLKVAWEPAQNLYQDLRPHAQVLFPESFRVGEQWLPATQARIVTSIAMFYDLDDPHRFVADICKVLHPQGVWVIQQAYLPAMLATTGVDNIGHEHLEYYHLRPLQHLLRVHGLDVVDVEPRAIDGGSFRTYVRWRHTQPVHDRVEIWEEEEALLCEDAQPAWDAFVERAQTAKRDLLLRVREEQARGRVVDLYGASTKGSTLLQWVGLDHTVIRQAWERSPQKVGRYYGPTGIPIVSEEEGRASRPDVLLAVIWQFKQALVEREQAYLKAGGRILFPLPKVEEVHG